MSAVLDEIQNPPRECWLISNRKPRRRQRIWVTRQQEDELLDTSRYEIVDGDFVEMATPDVAHGRMQAALCAALSPISAGKLGVIYLKCNFQLQSDLVRLPDIAFISFNRFPASGEPMENRCLIAPDIAVEIIAPTDYYADVFQKLDEYFKFGVRQVWLVEPERKILTVYRSRKNLTILTEEDELVSDGVLPGFRLKLSEIFQTPQPPINK